MTVNSTVLSERYLVKGFLLEKTFRWVSDGDIQAFKVERGLGAAEAKTLKLNRDKNTLIRSHKMFTYLHPYAFVFIHEAQILESFPHIEGSLPMIDLYTVYVWVISDLPPCWLVRLQVPQSRV